MWCDLVFYLSLVLSFVARSYGPGIASFRWQLTGNWKILIPLVTCQATDVGSLWAWNLISADQRKLLKCLSSVTSCSVATGRTESVQWSSILSCTFAFVGWFAVSLSIVNVDCVLKFFSSDGKQKQSVTKLSIWFYFVLAFSNLWNSMRHTIALDTMDA